MFGLPMEVIGPAFGISAIILGAATGILMARNPREGRRTPWLLVLFILFRPSPLRAQSAAGAVPLEPGRTWEYRGSARWAGPDQRVDSASIQWTMRILEVRDGPDRRVALVRGWIQELAWYQPGQVPGYSLLIARGDRLYHLDAADSAAAVQALQRAVEPGATVPEGSELIIDSTLAVGHLYGGTEGRGTRSDTFYAWYVESSEPIHPPEAWSAANRKAVQWRLVYRTMPDHQILDLVPWVGVTHYTYGHHGTVADADVALVSVRRVASDAGPGHRSSPR